MFNFIKHFTSLFVNLTASYVVSAAWVIWAPLGTAVPGRVNTTQWVAQTSFETYNNTELEVVSIARGRTPFMHTLINLGRGLNWGNYKDFGFNEKLSSNFPIYKWMERDEANDIFSFNAIATAAATTVVLASTSGLYAGLVIRNIVTNEQLRIVSVTNATTIVVERWVGTIVAAPIALGQGMQVLSSASTKGQATLSAFWVANQNRDNFFQKFLTTFTQTDFDNLAYKVKWGEDIIAEKTIQHALEIEKAALFGQKKASTDPVTGQPYYTMEWVIENCKRGWTNDISAALTRTTLEEALTNPLKYTKDGSYKKIVLCGTWVKSAISALFTQTLAVTQIKDVDLRFESLRINQGEFIFIEHPLLDANTGYNGVMFVIDPSFCKVVYPEGKDMIKNAGMNGKTKFVMNTATNNFANSEASLVTYLTMENSNSNAFAAIRVI